MKAIIYTKVGRIVQNRGDLETCTEKSGIGKS